MLMIEAVRALDLAVRFVSGYACNPSLSEGVVGGRYVGYWLSLPMCTADKRMHIYAVFKH